MTRLNVKKTYKLFIGGKFPRTESGRYYSLEGKSGEVIANLCLASRKDVRNTIVAARKAQPGWASATAYNRGQVMYRLAEMLETRRASFIEEMVTLGLTKGKAEKEVNASVDRLVYYAGWCDKYSALFSSVNPTASAHFNFSVHEPTGVVAAVAPEESPLLGLVSVLAPAIAGGNSVMVLVSHRFAPTAISFAEVVQNSDVPGGVVNVLSGEADELVPQFLSHMDINAVVLARPNVAVDVLKEATGNIKRMVKWTSNWDREDPYMILDLQEVKTTWHPIQTSASGGGGY